MAYRPSLLVLTPRVRSMSTSLAASTVALATTAPDESLTTPEIVLCADAKDGNNRHGRVRKKKAVATNSAQLVARRERICGCFISFPSLNTNVRSKALTPLPAGILWRTRVAVKPSLDRLDAGEQESNNVELHGNQLIDVVMG